MSTEPAIPVRGRKKYRLYHERNQSLKATLMRRHRVSTRSSGRSKMCRSRCREVRRSGSSARTDPGRARCSSASRRSFVRIGRDRHRGKISALLELGAGFHPELSGRENVYLNGAILGLSEEAARRRFDEIVELCGHRAVHRRPGQELLVRHVRAARLFGGHQRGSRHPADRRGARGRRRRVPATLHRKFDEMSTGKTIVIVTHALGSSATSATRWRCSSTASSDASALQRR